MEKSTKEIIIKKIIDGRQQTKSKRERERTKERQPRIIVYGRKYGHFYTDALAGVDHLASP
jgi:hypothetical protein